MAIVQVLDENDRPVHCQVGAISPADGSTLATYTTNTNGQAIILQSVPWYPRVLVSKDYKSRTKILLYGDGHGGCYDYVVDGDGGGTNLTLASAVAAAAISHPAANAIPASIFICPGTYAESVTIGLNQYLRIEGAGRDVVIVGGISGASSGYTLDASASTGARLWLSSFTLKTNHSTSGTASGGLVTSSSNKIWMSDMNIQGNTGPSGAAEYGATIEMAGGTAEITNCEISGAYGVFASGSNAHIVIDQCHFNNCTQVGLRFGEDSIVSNCLFDTCVIGILVSSTSTDLNISGNHFLSCTTDIKCNGTIASDVLIQGNTDDLGGTFVDLSSLTGGSGSIDNWVIANNRTHIQATTGVFLKLPNTVRLTGVVRNNVIASSGSAPIILFTGTLHHTLHFSGNFVQTSNSSGSNMTPMEPIDGDTGYAFTARTWWLEDDTPAKIGCIDHYIAFGDTDVHVTRQTLVASSVSGNHYFEINSAGTLTENTTGFTAGCYHLCILNTTATPSYVSITPVAHIAYVGAAAGGSTTGPAPNTPQFLTLAADAGLVNERVFTPRYNIFGTDGGAGAAYSLDSWLEGAGLTPAAGALTLGTDGDMFHVAAGNFATIGTPTRQQLVILIFDGVSIVTHGTGANAVILQGATNFTSAAGDVLILMWEGTNWREVNRHTAAAATSAGHAIHEEVAAALTTRADLHFMGLGVFAQDNAGSTRTEVIIPTVYDAIVDAGDTNAVNKGNVYDTLQAAITAGHKTIVVRGTTSDASDIIIGTAAAGSTSGLDDVVTRVLGATTQTSVIPVNVNCKRSDVQFENLKFDGKTLTLGADRCTAFACLFTGAVTSGTALVNNGAGIANNATSIAFDNGANGGLPTRGHIIIDNELIGYSAGGTATSGTLTATATSRGEAESKQIGAGFAGGEFHADNATITSVMQGHLVVSGADCQAIQCRFIACTTTTTHCVVVMITADRFRLTSNVFLANSTYSCVAIFPNTTGTTNGPVGFQCVSNVFNANTCYSYLLEIFQPDSGLGAEVRGGQIAGNLFRQFEGGGIKLACALFNIAGNTFDGITKGTNQVLVNVAPGAAKVPVSSTFATPININIVGHGYTTGDFVRIAGHTVNTAANGTWTITVVDANNFTLNNSVGIAVGGATGTVTKEGIASYDATITYDTHSGASVLGALPPKGAVIIDSEEIYYFAKTVTTLLGCTRGVNGTTAVGHADNAVVTNLSQRALGAGWGNVGIGSIANLISGNAFSDLRVVYQDCDNSVGVSRPRLTFMTNQVLRCTTLYASTSSLLMSNAWVSLTVDFKSKIGGTVFGGGSAVTFSNVSADTALLMHAKPTAGVPAAFNLPDSQNFALGRTIGDRTTLMIPMVNNTGAASVINQVVTMEVGGATDYAFVNNAGLASTRVVGVVMENGIANGATCMVAIAGVVDVLCVAANAKGDLLQTSATAGQAGVAAPPATGTGFAVVLKAAGGAGATARVLLKSN